jgi:hypothetical protein
MSLPYGAVERADAVVATGDGGGAFSGEGGGGPEVLTLNPEP